MSTPRRQWAKPRRAARRLPDERPHCLLPWLAEPLARGLGLRSHALLLHGPGGVGQFELGLALATGWLCEAQDSTVARPCGHCGSCHLMAIAFAPRPPPAGARSVARATGLGRSHRRR